MRFPLAKSPGVIARFPRMQPRKKTPPSATELIDWLNGEGILELDWDFPENGDLFEAGLNDSAAMQNMVAALEDEYGIEFKSAEVSKARLGTPAKLAALIAAKQK